MTEDSMRSLALLSLLTKLEVAGPHVRRISAASMFVSDRPFMVSKYVFRLATVSTSFDYIVAVPFRDCDKNLLNL